jgi:catechol-2,3-dioxygenase
MRILELHLATRDLIAQRTFYVEQLGLPMQAETADSVTFQAGSTRLTFTAAPQVDATYHIAFNIPRNKLAAAKHWVAARTALLTQAGEDEFAVPAWGARMVYFPDPAGNLLECVVRQALPNDALGAFGPHDLLCVSEIGLVVDDVPKEVGALIATHGIAPYKEPSPTFTALGDEHGLVIVVQQGRPWFPTRTLAAVSPLRIVFRGEQEAPRIIENRISRYSSPIYPS